MDFAKMVILNYGYNNYGYDPNTWSRSLCGVSPILWPISGNKISKFLLEFFPGMILGNFPAFWICFPRFTDKGTLTGNPNFEGYRNVIEEVNKHPTGLNSILHYRTLNCPLNPIVRQNKDTLYSMVIVDTLTGPLQLQLGYSP